MTPTPQTDAEVAQLRAELARVTAELENAENVILATRQSSIEAMRAIRNEVGAPDDDLPTLHHVREALARERATRNAIIAKGQQVEQRNAELVAELRRLRDTLNRNGWATSATDAVLARAEGSTSTQTADTP